MNVKYMEFEEHKVVHFALALHQVLNMIEIFYGCVIPQQALSHGNKSVSR